MTATTFIAQNYESGILHAYGYTGTHFEALCGGAGNINTIASGSGVTKVASTWFLEQSNSCRRCRSAFNIEIPPKVDRVHRLQKIARRVREQHSVEEGPAGESSGTSDGHAQSEQTEAEGDTSESDKTGPESDGKYKYIKYEPETGRSASTSVSASTGVSDHLKISNRTSDGEFDYIRYERPTRAHDNEEEEQRPGTSLSDFVLELLRIRGRLGHPPSYSEFLEVSDMHPDEYKQEFDSWDQALSQL